MSKFQAGKCLSDVFANLLGVGFKDACMSLINAAKGGVDEPSLTCANVDLIWNSSQRPFLNVFSAVVLSSLNSRPNVAMNEIPISIIHDLGCVEMRIDREIAKKNNIPSNFFLCVLPPSKIYEGASMKSSEGRLIVYYLEGVENVVQSLNWTTKLCDDVQDVMDSIVTASLTEEDKLRVSNILKIAYIVLLLAADEKFIEPILLAKDRGKPRTKSLIDKAKRRGVFGFDVGKSIEISPHFRRPHFAIRWTGKGGKVPKLVPVVGSVVKREKLLDVPTGYEGKQ